jgi:hypothetical protein
MAQEYARKAKDCIQGGRNPEYARALLSVPDFILDRES